MKKAKLVLILSLAVVFAAGLALGVLVGRLRDEGGRPSWLTRRLDLTAQQREQMHEIWSEVMRGDGRSHWERVQELRKQREDALMGLLTEQQRAEYERLRQEIDREIERLFEQRREAFEQAVERTKEILTPRQREKYEEMLSRMPEDRRGPGQRPGPPFGGRPGPRGRRRDQSPPDSPPR